MSREAYDTTPELVEHYEKIAEIISNQFPDWKENAEKNFIHLKDSYISDIFGSWSGSNCVVIGAGKTAIENVESIKTAQRIGWKIIAVDRICSFLKENGITLDLIVSTDPQKKTIEFFTDLDEEDQVVMSITQNPEVVNDVVRKVGKVWFYLIQTPFSDDVRYLFEKYPDKLAALKCGGTVGTIAVDLAFWMCHGHGNMPKILLIGTECGWFDRESVDWPLIHGWFDENPIEITEEKIEEIVKRSSTIFHTKLSDGMDFYSVKPYIVTEEFMSSIPFWYGGDARFIDGSMGLIRSMEKIPFSDFVSWEALNADLYTTA